MRALAFAALPLLSLALLGGIVLRANRIELLGFVVQQPVLYGLLGRERADPAVPAPRGHRRLERRALPQRRRRLGHAAALGRAKLPVSPLSIAGLIAVVLVIAGGHIAVARYNLLAIDLVNCVFSEDEDPSCDEPTDTPDPADVPHRAGVGIEHAPSRPTRPTPSRPSRAA